MAGESMNNRDTALQPHEHITISFLSTVLTILFVSWFQVPNPAIICLIAVVFSTFLGGYVCGMLSGALTILYCGHFFLYTGGMLKPSVENMYKTAVVLAVVPLMVGMVGALKQRVDSRSAELKKRTEELERANKQLELLSTIDGLTGIPNRRYFESAYVREWQRSLHEQTPLALIMVDIDFFKNYNDRYGHQSGDACLRKVAGIMAEYVHSPGKITARYGGEEFIVLLSHANWKKAYKAAEKIRRKIENLQVPHEVSPVSEYVTVSIGVVSFMPSIHDHADDYVKMADIALYCAKHKGKNNVHNYGEGDKPFIGVKKEGFPAAEVLLSSK